MLRRRFAVQVIGQLGRQLEPPKYALHAYYELFHLAISPTRLLRAATFGRSIWERPLDATSLPAVDLYLRDDVVDVGRANPSPSGVPHPFEPATNIWWWQSPDIKVDAPIAGAYQAASTADDYVLIEGELAHRSPTRSQINRFYLQVHNRGVGRATNVRVRGCGAQVRVSSSER